MRIEPMDRQRVELLIDLIALVTKTERGTLMMSGRGVAPVARCRQLAMYLSHVVYGYSLAKVGALFGREKSTVGHAVRQIEDLRDCEDFEGWISALEQALDASQRAAARPVERTVRVLFQPASEALSEDAGGKRLQAAFS